MSVLLLLHGGRNEIIGREKKMKMRPKIIFFFSSLRRSPFAYFHLRKKKEKFFNGKVTSLVLSNFFFILFNIEKQKEKYFVKTEQRGIEKVKSNIFG